MVIDVIDRKETWDRFVEDSADALLFHRWDFLKIVEKHHDHRLYTYGVYSDGELIGIFPLFLKKKLALKFLFSPPPGAGLQYLGPIIGTTYARLPQWERESLAEEIAGSLRTAFRRSAPNYVSFTLAPGIADVRPFMRDGYKIEPRFTHTISLEEPIDEIWSGFSKDCRSRIRSVDPAGVELLESNDPETIYQSLKTIYNRQGMTPPKLSPPYLRDLIDAFPENIKIFSLLKSSEVADIEGVYAYKDKFKLLWGATSTTEKTNGYQEYFTWEMIKKARREGYKTFEIAGANTRSIVNYQSKFNPSLTMYYSVYRSDLIGRLAELGYTKILRRLT